MQEFHVLDIVFIVFVTNTHFVVWPKCEIKASGVLIPQISKANK